MLETDKAVVYCTVVPDDSDLALALKEHHKSIEQATGTPMHVCEVPNGQTVVTESCSNVKEAEVKVHSSK